MSGVVVLGVVLGVTASGVVLLGAALEVPTPGWVAAPLPVMPLALLPLLSVSPLPFILLQAASATQNAAARVVLMIVIMAPLNEKDRFES